MNKIYPNTKVYISCPANIATGGPELLNQLCYHLKKDLKINAFIYYYNFKSNKFSTPVHPEYSIYNNYWVTEILESDDTEKNILIVPEILDTLDLLTNYKKIRKGVWFLSVDFYYLSRLKKKDYFIQRAINKIFKIIIKKPLLDFDITSKKVIENLFKKYDYRYEPLLKLANFYIFQSYYAFEHFKELNPKYYLSDYLNEDFLKTQTDLSKKENMVAYNPKKGFSFTKKLIEKSKDIQFVPLINLTRNEVIETLQKAKVYIDFGNHPGKDRIPRESAILGCCVITNKRGSAAFYEDVSIPDEYKFEDKEENIPKIINKIKDCFKNYEERYKDFEYYRQMIKNEPKKFMEDLKKIFVKAEK